MVHIRIIAKLVRMPAREIVAAHMAERTLTAETNTLDGVVAAFDGALGPVLKEIVTWSLAAVPPERPNG